MERRLGLKDTGTYYIEVESLQQAKHLHASMLNQISRMDVVHAKSGLPGHVGIELVIKDPKQRQTVFAELQARDDILIVLPDHT